MCLTYRSGDPLVSVHIKIRWQNRVGKVVPLSTVHRITPNVYVPSEHYFLFVECVQESKWILYALAIDVVVVQQKIFLNNNNIDGRYRCAKKCSSKNMSWPTMIFRRHFHVFTGGTTQWFIKIEVYYTHIVS